MLEYINRITNFFSFFLSFFVIVISLMLFLDYFLKKNKANIKIFGMFMGLTNRNIISLTFITTAYIFFIWQLFAKSIDIVTLGVILICLVLTDIVSKKFISLFFSIINSVIIYLGLYCKCVFYDYINAIHFSIIEVVLLILLIIVLFFYMSYILIRKADYIFIQNKYVKKIFKKSS